MHVAHHAYRRRGRDEDAARGVGALRWFTCVAGDKFKTVYAGNAMPVRLAIETRDWSGAANLTPLPGSTPQVAAQARVLLKSAEAWRHAAAGEHDAAVAALTIAADEEDALEKLPVTPGPIVPRSEEHTSELQSLMSTSYAVFCLKKK